MFSWPCCSHFSNSNIFLCHQDCFSSSSSEDWELCRESCQRSGTDHSISCNSSASHKPRFPVCPSLKARDPSLLFPHLISPRCTPGAHRSSTPLPLILPFIWCWGTFQPMVHLWYQSVAQLPTWPYTHIHTHTQVIPWASPLFPDRHKGKAIPSERNAISLDF